jgi:hypothetical protein
LVEISIIAGWSAGILGFLAFVPYFFAILHNKTIPNRATWFIWTMVNTISLLSFKATGAGPAIWFAISDAVAPCIVLILSLQKGEGGWTKLDQICLLTASIGVFLWWVSGSAFIGLFMSLTADALGAIPTIKKVYKNPQTEDRLAWTMTTIATVINLFAIENWSSPLSLLYPVYMLFIMGLITSLIWVRICSSHKCKLLTFPQ